MKSTIKKNNAELTLPADISVPEILVISDGGVPTGFARVSESIIWNLLEKYRFHQLATNYKGDPNRLDWDLYPASSGGDRLGIHRIPELYRKLQPSLCFLIGDPWVVNKQLTMIFEVDPNANVVVYCPVDAGPVDPNWFRHIDKVKSFVTYTNFGKEEIISALGKHHKNIGIIPHGVNKKDFYPIKNTSYEAKVQLGIIEDGDPEPYVVLNANRNQPRKRIDLTIRGFAKFHKKYPQNTKLFLHMECSDCGWDYVRLCKRLGIEKSLVLSAAPTEIHPNVSNETLNLIYNACDVGINTSGGEGWGLVSLEHASTGKAQIVCNHSACKEIWDGVGELLEIREVVTQPGTGHDLKFTSESDISFSLEKLYVNLEQREKTAQACLNLSNNPKYSWKIIADEWERIFNSAIG